MLGIVGDATRHIGANRQVAMDESRTMPDRARTGSATCRDAIQTTPRKTISLRSRGSTRFRRERVPRFTQLQQRKVGLGDGFPHLVDGRSDGKSVA